MTDVVVTALGRDVRRQVGPGAWSVLEELVARAAPDRSSGIAVEGGVADLVQALGLSAEVVRSALRRLVAAGFVERQDVRSEGSQRFAGASYRVIAATGLVAVAGTVIPGTGEPHTDVPDTAPWLPPVSAVARVAPTAPATNSVRPRPAGAASRPFEPTVTPIDEDPALPLGPETSGDEGPSTPRRRRSERRPSPQLSLLDASFMGTADAEPDDERPAP